MIRRQLYEIARPPKAYQELLPEAHFQDPVPFRDKFLLAIRKTDDTKEINEQKNNRQKQ